MSFKRRRRRERFTANLTRWYISFTVLYPYVRSEITSKRKCEATSVTNVSRSLFWMVFVVIINAVACFLVSNPSF